MAHTACPVTIVSYVIGCGKNMGVKAGTFIQTGPPAMLAHLVSLSSLYVPATSALVLLKWMFAN
jgi:hypothetical protein